MVRTAAPRRTWHVHTICLSVAPVSGISNARNLGFPAAINQGLRIARGQYLVMSNNDVVVTDAWLGQLIALTHGRIAGAGTEENTETDFTAKNATIATKNLGIDELAAEITALRSWPRPRTLPMMIQAQMLARKAGVPLTVPSQIILPILPSLRLPWRVARGRDRALAKIVG
jgi:hypothetical protein